MNRRDFGKVMGLLAIIVLSFGYVLRRWKVVRNAVRGVGIGDDPALWRPRVVADLQSHFDYLSLHDAVLTSYVDDLEARFEGVDPVRFKDASEIHMQFLMSTDFFPTGAQEDRPPRYVALYDPYYSPCYNPLSIAG